MLAVNALQIRLHILRPLQTRPDALARNEEAAEELEKAPELRIARRLGDRLVEPEVFLDGRFAASKRRSEREERALDPGEGGRRDALGGDAGRLDFDAGAKLHHVQDVADRAHLRRVDSERSALDVARDEGADALARLDQPFGAQHRNRLTHDCATH
ncbi:MAG TPA: hypothetical protein VFF43_03795, partial [Caldimonas sp.]|nr:hypothetical protein [Caldimonas sp.]